MDYTSEDIYITAKAPGKTKLTITGERYTYTINLTVKKLDVTAKFYKKLPDGNYILKVTNNTKEGYFKSVQFAAAYRASDGEFIDFEEEGPSAYYLFPGKTYYITCKLWNDYDFDLSKSTLEASSFDTDVLTAIKYTDYSTKIKLTDRNNGVVSVSDHKIAVDVKNNAPKAVTAIVQVCWYDENQNMVYADFQYRDVKQKKTGTLKINVPDEKYNAVSYSISGYGYYVYDPSNKTSFDSLTFKLKDKQIKRKLQVKKMEDLIYERALEKGKQIPL